jgi:hypothetical protein
MARPPIVSTRQLANFELSDFFIVHSCGFSAHLKVATEEHDEIIAILSGMVKLPRKPLWST